MSPSANGRGRGDPAPGDDFQVKLGRMIGLTVVSFGLLFGGGILLILVAAVVFRFMYGG